MIYSVSTPPKDQQHVDRLGLLYFSRLVFFMLLVLILFTTLSSVRTMTSHWRLPKIRRFCSAKATLPTSLSSLETMSPLWKVRVYPFSVLRRLKQLYQNGLSQSRHGREPNMPRSATKRLRPLRYYLDGKRKCMLEHFYCIPVPRLFFEPRKTKLATKAPF